MVELVSIRFVLLSTWSGYTDSEHSKSRDSIRGRMNKLLEAESSRMSMSAACILGIDRQRVLLRT